jgi:hypothetical protein
MYQIKTTDQFGRGLYATETIRPRRVVMRCELLVLSPTDTVIVNATELKHYTFVFNSNQDCLVLGLGEIFNHSDKPNVSYQIVDFEGRKVMQFVSLSQIEPGQQLFINYENDSKVDVSKYVEQKSLLAQSETK